jgi:hypothetical protein
MLKKWMAYILISKLISRQGPRRANMKEEKQQNWATGESPIAQFCTKPLITPIGIIKG